MENNTSIQTAKNLQAPSFDEAKLKLLKNTICKGASDDEFQLFLHACERTGLDPFMKQIYSIPRKTKNKNGEWEETRTIQTGVDGFRLIAERTGNYAPGREPSYHYDEKGRLISSTAYVKKRTSDGTWHEIAATAFFEEYKQEFYNKKDDRYELSTFWKKMPHVMLAKVAEAVALRKAFPADLSGLYTSDEMAQAEVTTLESSPAEEESKCQKEVLIRLSQPEAPILCITVEQVEELRKILKECDPACPKRLLAYFRIQRLEELSDKDFEKAKTTCLRNRENWLKKQQLVEEFEKYQQDLNQKKEVVYA